MIAFFKNLFTFAYCYIFAAEDNSYNTERISHNLYQVYYRIKGKDYKFLVNPSRLPDKILEITTNSGYDITDEIKPYLNHNRNFKTNKLEKIYNNHRSINILNIDGTMETYNL